VYVVEGHRHALAATHIALHRRVRLTYTVACEGPHRAEIEEELRTVGVQGNVTLIAPTRMPRFSLLTARTVS